jgi:uncharacterized protein
MSECEANYVRIMQLLPDMSCIDVREFGIELVGSMSGRFKIRVTERCKYTTMLDVSQLPSIDNEGTHPLNPCFSLRVYHDARMAEVVAYNRHRHLRSSYDYPNNNMYQRDEKAQLNSFLGEWLSHCLKHGYVLENPAALLS